MKKWKYTKPIKDEDLKVSQEVCWSKKVNYYYISLDGHGFSSIISKDDLIRKVRKGLGYHQGLDIKDLEKAQEIK